MNTGTDRVEESIKLASRARIFAETYNGPNYFKDLALFLQDLLKIKSVLIARVEEGRNALVAEAFCNEGSVSTTFVCDLDESVFEQVVRTRFYYHPGGLKDLLLENAVLRKMGVESFMGTALYGNSAKVRGLLAVMNNKEIEDPDAVELAFSAVLSRTSREIASSKKQLSSR